MLFSSPAGNDLLFGEKLCEQGRNFANKIWNAFRLVQGWKAEDIPAPAENKVAVTWFRSRLAEATNELEDHFSKYRLSDALVTLYKLSWDDFCSWYLEAVKPEYGKPIDIETQSATRDFFEGILKLLHPFMPFITEELWHGLVDREAKDCIIRASWPVAGTAEAAVLDAARIGFEIISGIRNLRSSQGLSPKEALELHVKGDGAVVNEFAPVIKKLANLKGLHFSGAVPQGPVSTFMVGMLECMVPMPGHLDAAKEADDLKKELEYQRGFLTSVSRKLENEKFVKSAPPQVVEAERKKKADAEARIAAIEKSLAALKE
jgi:valyl-tRNA synthetase